MRTVLLLLSVIGVNAASLDTQDIIRRSVAANDANWNAAPNYTFTEREVKTAGESKTVMNYRVWMIEGSPYNELVAINDKPLSPAEQAKEKQKLARETKRREDEGQSERSRRIAKYQSERRQDHALMQEMTKALTFRLRGTATLDGHAVYVFDATPRPGYQPSSHETRVLTGMKGTLWVDKETYQWVKVEAEVFRPVPFGLFIAKVNPGTRFILEQAPVSGGLWQPKRFRVEVRASIFWRKRNSDEDSTYSDYRLNKPATQQHAMASRDSLEHPVSAPSIGTP